MGGALIKCGDFEGADKSGSPISAVLSEVFKRAFGRKPRGRIALALARIVGGQVSGIEAIVESALVSVNYDDVARLPPAVAAHLLPFLKEYQTEVLSRLGINDEYDEIRAHLKGGTRTKYGFVLDDGWHALCLHDLIPACERSRAGQVQVEIIW
ncbi:MAG TPA: hypothetical protein VK138_06585 [Acidiferrobacterales bacterium]|nr:hypothetical protein [Acidiferrobacterales bacterium]